jgi:hypothetical protein
MTARLCPSTGRACGRECVNRLRAGRCFLDDEREYTLEEIAKELRVDERSVRRTEESALRKLRAILDPDFSSTGNPTFLRVPRRFPDIPGSFLNHAPRTDCAPPFEPFSRVGSIRRRAGLFSHRNNMTKKTSATLVAEFEALALGEPWADQLAAATGACASQRYAAERKLFPFELTPVPADAIAAYAWHIDRLNQRRYGDELAMVHQRALNGHPALAQLCRTHDAVTDVSNAAGTYATAAHSRETHATAALRVAEEGRRRYQRLIAKQLADLVGHELRDAAQSYLEAEAHEERLDAAKARHEAHARTELEQVEIERKTVARAESALAVGKVRDAEAAAADARAKATLAEREYRKLRAEAFAQRLRASGLKQLRVGRGDGAELYGVDDLLVGATANGYTLETLAKYEAALAKHEAEQ